jgi:hypothetical protein
VQPWLSPVRLLSLGSFFAQVLLSLSLSVLYSVQKKSVCWHDFGREISGGLKSVTKTKEIRFAIPAIKFF